jgi:cytochrome oxidase assembly protein ShyY1
LAHQIQLHWVVSNPYNLKTPFILDNKTTILVNRGFVPWYGNREKLVDITISEAKTSIQVKLIKTMACSIARFSSARSNCQNPNNNKPHIVRTINIPGRINLRLITFV